MSKIKNGGLDQYGAEPFEQQQFGPAGVEGVKSQLQSTLFLAAYGLLTQNGPEPSSAPDSQPVRDLSALPIRYCIVLYCHIDEKVAWKTRGRTDRLRHRQLTV